MDVLLFGGTTEGRLLAEWLDARGTCTVVTCTATEYGAELLPHGPHVRSLVGPLSPADKSQLMKSHDFVCVIDATHPYAQHISASIDKLARAHGKDVVRVARTNKNPSGGTVPLEGFIVGVASMEEAACHVATTADNVLLTTGSKDVATFVAAMSDFKERLYVRILPVRKSLDHVLSLSIPPSHVVAMQGPFSVQLNRALIEELNIACMVTKQSGVAGGFDQKVQAARECGIELVVVQRPQQHDGLSLKEAKALLEERYGL